MNDFAICVVSYNTCSLLRACLDSVRNQANTIIVVDNGSTDGTLEMLNSMYPRVQVILNTHNAGYGAAANAAIAHCNAPYVLLLNSDTRLAPNTLGSLRTVLDQHPDVALVGPRLRNSDGSVQPSCFHFPSPLEVFLDMVNAHLLIRFIPRLRDVYLRTWFHTQPRQVPWLSGAALALRRSAFKAVNGFDPTFLFYYEETDLCFRLRRAGWEILFSPGDESTDVIHVGGASSPGPVRQSQLTVQLYASLAHFYRQHYGWVARAALAVLLETMALLRWLRDAWQLQHATTHDERTTLQTNLRAWRQMLRGHWLRQKPLGVSGPAPHRP